MSIAEPTSPSAPFTLPQVLILGGVGVGGGILVGALTNAINGWISPEYFRDVMSWNGGPSKLWLAAVAQGMLEGAIYGLAFSTVFVLVLSILSGGQCSLALALQYSLLIFASAIALWIVGGSAAVAFTRLFPENCDGRFFGHHTSPTSLARYGWVRGSIWGIVYGGFLSVLATNAYIVLQQRRFRFGLRALLVWLTAMGIGLGVTKAVGFDAISGFRGVLLSFVLALVFASCLWPLASLLSRVHHLWSFLVTPVIYASLGLAFYMFGEAIDQPHPQNLHGNWLTVASVDALWFMPVFAIGALFFVTIDTLARIGWPMDSVYFPDFGKLLTALQSRKGRLMLLLGSAPILAIYGLTVVEVMQQSGGGLVFPPKRVFVSCVLLWGLLWLVERSCRSQKFALVAPCVFLALSWFLLPVGLSVARE